MNTKLLITVGILVVILVLCFFIIKMKTKEVDSAKTTSDNNMTNVADQKFNLQQYPDSPVPPSPNWEGIIIQQKKGSAYERPIIIRGYYRLKYSDMLKDDSIIITAVDNKTGKVFTGIAGQDEENIVIKPNTTQGNSDNKNVNGLIIPSYFNIDFTETLNIPKENAAYNVTIKIGDKISNTLLLNNLIYFSS